MNDAVIAELPAAPVAASSREPLTIRMHERDNVAIVANDGGLPPGAVLSSGLVLRDRVPQGHKVALVDLPAAAPILSCQLRMTRPSCAGRCAENAFVTHRSPLPRSCRSPHR